MLDKAILQLPVHRLECLRLIEETVESLDDRGLAELLQGSGGDLDKLFEVMMEDTHRVMYTGDTNVDFTPKYPERLAQSLEEILREHNITYFITSVLPDFQMSRHHLEWGDFTMRYNKLCIEAARDHGKCIGINDMVMMYDGTFKLAKDIVSGESLMGWDSNPRVVNYNERGQASMYSVITEDGRAYNANLNHEHTVLLDSKEIVEMSTLDLLNLDTDEKGYIKGVHLISVEPVRSGKHISGYDVHTMANGICTDGFVPSYLKLQPHELNTETARKLVRDIVTILDEKHGSRARRGGRDSIALSITDWLTIDIFCTMNHLFSLMGCQLEVQRQEEELVLYFDKRAEAILNYSDKIDLSLPNVSGVNLVAKKRFKIKPSHENEYCCINVTGRDKRYVLNHGIVTHNSYYFSNAYPIWKLYTYAKQRRGAYSQRPDKFNSNRGYLFSFSLQQSVDLMEILKGTIEGNDILRDRLFPASNREGAWSGTNIVCKNGARLTCKGFGSSVRGAHPYWIIVDDGLKDNVIYSKLQRQKSIDYFHSVIMNMLVPRGQIVVVGTPFHANDLYGDLKTKNGWMVVEYPAIFPNGEILWPNRWSFRDLMDKRATQGNIIFSRENLCRPVTNEASIFPLSILERSLYRMEDYTLVKDRDSFPIKFPRVVVGCDFAISANVGSDYTVFTVWGVDDDNERWLMYFYRESGKTFNEQMQILKGINLRFRPDSMILEQNAFQQIFVQESDKAGLPVVGHTTGIDKFDLKSGWPGLAIDFERGKIHIPIGDEHSRNVKDLIFSDLSSVAFTDKGLASVGEHDDISSSFWLAKLGANLMTTGFKYTFLD